MIDVPDVSIIIVNHNTKELCSQTIAALRGATHIAACEIIVVDNSSKKEEFYDNSDNDIILLSGVENKGFGNACNIGAKRAAGKYLLFLNSDTILDNHALDKSFAYMEAHKNTGALGIRTVLSDGSVDLSSKRGFPTPFNAMCYFLRLDRLFPKNRTVGGYHLTYLSPDETNKVDCVSGSFLMTPRRVFEEIGGFDEAFFMYGDDLDLCYRIKEKGYDIVYFADAGMLHLKGQSGLHTDNPAVLGYFYDAMLVFYDKHYKSKYNFIVGAAMRAAVRGKYWVARRGINKVWTE